MAFTVEEVKNRLQIWLNAEEAIAKGQSYSIDNQRLERANLAQVREQIKFWQRESGKATLRLVKEKLSTSYQNRGTLD
ncbi:hypothetical protein FOH38_23640 [Lysinibacillus fusiformis]|nr:hypothetical protein FOH38_23640 [Lysinibacillus fusiformis]